MSEQTWLEQVTKDRVVDKPPSCKSCPLYNELIIYEPSTSPEKKRCDVLVLAPSPTPFRGRDSWQIERQQSLVKLDQVFEDQAGKITKSIVTKVCEKIGFSGKVGFSYGVKCRTFKPSKAATDHCNSYLSQYLDEAQPKVIVPMGTEAMKALGMKSQIKTQKGKLQEIEVSGKTYKVIPTFHPFKFIASPGTIDEFKIDMERALMGSEDKDIKAYSITKLTENYLLPKSLKEVVETVDTILNYERFTPIAVDIETNAIQPVTRGAKSITISFAWDEGKSATIILDHKQSSDQYKKDLPKVITQVKRLLESDRPKIGHNFKFDWKFLVCKEKYKINNFANDTLLMEHLLNEERSVYNLKALVRDYFPEFSDYEEATEAVKISAEFKKKWFPKFTQKLYPPELHFKKSKDPELLNFARGIYSAAYTAAREAIEPLKDFLVADYTYEDLPIDDLCLYAAIDADVTWRLAKHQIGRLKLDNGDKAKHIRELQSLLEDNTVSEEDKELVKEDLEKQVLLKDLLSNQVIPMSNLISQVEYHGIRIDADKAKSWIKESFARMNEINSILSTRFNKANLNTPAQLSNILYSKLGLPVIKKTPSGAPSTDEETLQKLYEKTQNDVLKLLIDYREAKSCYEKSSGYLRAASLDGSVHSDLMIWGTSTGRLSSGGGVNLQNIISRKKVFGKKLKSLFITHDPKTMKFGNMDLGTAEITILTAYARDENLIKAILDGLDTHSYTASQIYDIDYKDINEGRTWEDENPDKVKPQSNGFTYSQMRTMAKTTTFGIIYGITAKNLHHKLEIEIEQAQQLINNFLNIYPGIKLYMDSTVNEAKTKGYVDTFFGRKRRFPILYHEPNNWHVRNQAINFRIQSTSAEMLNAQMLELAPHLESDLRGRILTQVHDSIVFEYDKNIPNEKVQKFFNYYITQRIAEKYKWLPVPMKCDVEVGPNYGDLVKIK